MNRENLANGIIASASGSTFILEAGQGADMPAVPFFGTTAPMGEISTKANSEIVEVTAVVGDTLTVTRAQRGTSEQPVESGWVFGNGVYTEDLDAITAYVDAAIAAAREADHPIGSLYYNADDATNPEDLLGFGTWAAFAQGQVPVGKAASGTFGTAGATPGTETVTLTTAQMPGHTHTGGTSTNGDHTHGYSTPYKTNDAPFGNNGRVAWEGLQELGRTTGGGGSHSHTFTTASTGGGGAHNNIQPSVVVYIWRRTA